MDNHVLLERMNEADLFLLNIFKLSLNFLLSIQSPT